MQRKAQGAIEYLLIIGAAVIIAVIVITLMMGLSGTGTKAIGEAGLESAYSGLMIQKEKTGNFYYLFGQSFSTSDPIVQNLQIVNHFEEPAGATSTSDSKKTEEWNCDEEKCPLWVNEGYFGKGAKFDGVDDYLVSDFVLPLNHTLSLLIKPSTPMGTNRTTQKQQMFFASRSSLGWGYIGPRDQYFDFIYYTCQYVTGRNCGTEYDGSGSGPILNANEWYQITLTQKIENNTLTRIIYINGQQKAAYGAATPANFEPLQGATIGAINNWGYFDGIIDEMLIWDRALDPDEVSELFEITLGN